MRTLIGFAVLALGGCTSPPGDVALAPGWPAFVDCMEREKAALPAGAKPDALAYRRCNEQANRAKAAAHGDGY